MNIKATILLAGFISIPTIAMDNNPQQVPSALPQPQQIGNVVHNFNNQPPAAPRRLRRLIQANPQRVARSLFPDSDTVAYGSDEDLFGSDLE